MLQDDCQIRLEMTLYLCGPGTLFDDFGEQHLFRNFKAALAVLRKVRRPLVKCRWKCVVLVRENFFGFLVEFLRIIRSDRFG
ncbi:MAG: hypothetical protein WAK31_08380 [Chthoniobacterales bacterium]